jgi:peptide/nickel transport system substrate-binding protein
MTLNRRDLLKTAAAGTALTLAGLPARAQGIEELVIAYNVTLPSWDPTVGPSAVNPTIQGLYQSVFDQFILQQPDLQPAPGLLTEWGWNEDRTRSAWSCARASPGTTAPPSPPRTWPGPSPRRRPRDRQPDQFVWATLENFAGDGNVVTPT